MEAERQFRDLADALELGLGGTTKLAGGVIELSRILQQIKDIGYSFQGIVNFVSDRCRHAPGNRELFRTANRLLRHFGLRNITGCRGSAYNRAQIVANRRDCEYHSQFTSVL